MALAYVRGKFQHADTYEVCDEHGRPEILITDYNGTIQVSWIRTPSEAAQIQATRFAMRYSGVPTPPGRDLHPRLATVCSEVLR